MKNENYKIIIGVNLSPQAPLGYCRFQIGCVVPEQGQIQDLSEGGARFFRNKKINNQEQKNRALT